MAVYTVHEPPGPRAERIERAENLVFVRDGFSWAAALFAPIWLLLNRLWLAFLGYIVVVAALGFGLAMLDAEHWTGWAILALHLLVGFEADTLRRRKLERRGWRLVGTVTGPSRLTSLLRRAELDEMLIADILARQDIAESRFRETALARERNGADVREGCDPCVLQGCEEAVHIRSLISDGKNWRLCHAAKLHGRPRMSRRFWLRIGPQRLGRAEVPRNLEIAGRTTTLLDTTRIAGAVGIIL